MNDQQFQALKKVFQLNDIKVLMKPFMERDEAEYKRVRGEVIEAKFAAAEEILNPVLDKPLTKESLGESIDEACAALMIMFLKDVITSALTGAAMPGSDKAAKIKYGVEGENGEIKIIDPADLVPGPSTPQ